MARKREIPEVTAAEMAKMQADYEASLPKCPECGTPMTFKHSSGGDFEGRFSTDVHQCPKCKNIEIQ